MIDKTALYDFNSTCLFKGKLATCCENCERFVVAKRCSLRDKLLRSTCCESKECFQLFSWRLFDVLLLLPVSCSDAKAFKGQSVHAVRLSCIFNIPSGQVCLFSSSSSVAFNGCDCRFCTCWANSRKNFIVPVYKVVFAVPAQLKTVLKLLKDVCHMLETKKEQTI